ncbi:MAG TPA: zf-HC2 domain-containing protein, partial [Pirellulales bacterium]
MNDHQQTCDPRHIEACLADSLSDEQRCAFEAHLEVCPACRLALEVQAAPPSDWQEAREFLSSDSALPTSAQHGDDDRQLSADPDSAESNRREAVDTVLSG